MISLRAHLKRIAPLGGIARAKSLTPARRKEIATKASHARKKRIAKKLTTTK